MKRIRKVWERKPQVQVVPNRKAIERKMACRKENAACTR